MVKRERYMGRIRPFINGNLVKVLTGMRRSGKSVMLQLIQQEILQTGVGSNQILTYNFEKMDYASLRTAEALHQAVLSASEGISGKIYLFFDEIQEVDGWEKAVNSFRVSLDCDIYITGSNANLLSGELATYLAGRYVEFIVYPFSFQEFMDLYQTIIPKSTQRDMFNQYVASGGMPYLSNLRYEQESSRQYLLDIFNSVILKDVVKRNNIRDVDLLERIISYVISNVGTTFSATSISKYFKSEKRNVAPETILNYLKACEEAFLLYRAKRQDLQGKQILSIKGKYYMSDHGIRQALMGTNARDIGLILENMVYLELLRRGFQVTVGRVGEREIDFVCEKAGRVLYFQVCYLLATEETIDREFGVFSFIKDNHPKYVLSLDDFDMSREGIKHMNIQDFLLSDEWS